MENLPLEITANILSSLPMVFKSRSREVCKTWRTLVPKPRRGLIYVVLLRWPWEKKLVAQFYFSEHNIDKVDDDYLGALTKLEHRIILPSSSSFSSFMVGSCRGLVCYASYCSSGAGERKIYICNPVTREEFQIQTIYKWDDNPKAEQAIGFGYNRSNNEYKVVRILLDTSNHRDGTIQVYTLQGGAMWRKSRASKIKNCFDPELGGVVPIQVGVFAGGVLYWMGNCGRKPATIVAFDLEHETLSFLPLLPSVPDDANMGLTVLGGDLCAVEVVPGEHVRIWELRNSKADKNWQKLFRWREKFSIEREIWSWFEPTKSDNYVLLYNAILSCYDPETKTLRKLQETLKKLMADGSRSVYTSTQATPFMHGLVSMKEETVGKKRKAPWEINHEISYCKY